MCVSASICSAVTPSAPHPVVLYLDASLDLITHLFNQSNGSGCLAVDSSILQISRLGATGFLDVVATT